MGEKIAFLEARQTTLPRGKKMPISPMTSSELEKGLSQEVEGGETVTSAVIRTGEEEEDEEGRKAVTRREVVGPTKKEREEHEATHCPYRSWCRHCVRGEAEIRPTSRRRKMVPMKRRRWRGYRWTTSS